jgi:hypothetical protein
LRVKRFLFFTALCLLAACLAILAGCSLPNISPEQRAYSLVAGLNSSSRESLAGNFLPTINDYATLMDPTLYSGVWDPNFPYANAPYTIMAIDTGNPAAAAVTLVAGTGTWGPMYLVLVMERLGNDWFIRELWMDPALPVSTVIVD